MPVLEAVAKLETGAKEVLRQGQLRQGQSSVINSLGGAGKVLKW